MPKEIRRVNASGRREAPPDIALEGAGAGRPKDISALEGAGRPFTIHIIPQAHIDLAWMWTREDGDQMVLETFRRHAEALERDRRATYAQSQLAAYRLVERRDPDLFERIRRLVRAGQWEVVGGQWVEPDNALPSGESHIRQLIHGQRYAREKFGAACRVAWCPDSFTEQPASLVDLLAQAGMRFLFLKRPREKLFPLPAAPFRWESPSGARIIAYRTNNKGYGWPLLSEGAEGGLRRIVSEHRAAGLTHLWAPLGCGDVGGLNDYAEPERGEGWRQRYSLPSRWFDAVAREGGRRLPVVRGELGPIMTGALTTHAEMKSANRAAEAALHQAEFAWGLWSLMTRRAVPTDARDNLRRAWESVLFNQFHDIVAGVCLPEVHVRALHDYHEAIQTARGERDDAAIRIERRMKSRGAEREVLVFNGLGWRRNAMVAGEVDLLVTPTEAVRLHWRAVDDAGVRSPVGVALRCNAQNKHFRWRVHFQANDLPAFGVKRFRLVPDHITKTARPAPGVRRRGWRFESDTLCVEFDPARGCVGALETGKGKRCLRLEGPLAQWILWEEGHYVPDYGQELRAWYLGLSGRRRAARLRRIEAHEEADGWRVETTHAAGRSFFHQTFHIRQGATRLDVLARMEWQEVETLARLHFNVRSLGSDVEARRDGPYRIAPLPGDGREHPMQTMCAARGNGGSLAVVNDGRYGCSFDGRQLTISAIRCATWPDPLSDRGAYEFEYAILPDAAPLDDARLLAEGLGFNHRPWLAACDPLAPGEPIEAGPAGWSPVRIETGAALATALKPLASGKAGAAMRIFNPTLESQRLRAEGPGLAAARGDILERVRRGVAPDEMSPGEIATIDLRP